MEIVKMRHKNLILVHKLKVKENCSETFNQLLSFKKSFYKILLLRILV